MNRYVPLIALLLLASCAAMEDAPPYLVGGPAVFCSEKPGAYRFAGIEFDFFNKAAVSVASFSVGCRVYASQDGGNPLTGTNALTARFDGTVAPGEMKHLCISLDSRIAAIPGSPYIVDFFTVPEVVYADGSSWTDPHCLFYARSY